jgi:hypothetical protein
MARTKPPAWFFGFPLFSQRENETPLWELGERLNNDDVRLVPAHLDLRTTEFRVLGIIMDALCIMLVVLDIFKNAEVMSRFVQLVADDKSVDVPSARKENFTLPLIRMMAYGLYFLDTAYRLSRPYEFFKDWSGPGSCLCRKLRELLPRTSNIYTVLRVMTTIAICSVLLCCVIFMENGTGIVEIFDNVTRRVTPLYVIISSFWLLYLNLHDSRKSLAKWIYRRDGDVDRVTFRFQLDRWRRWEKSSSLGLDLRDASNPLDQESRRTPIYAPPQTVRPGLSLPMSAARREAKTQTPLFVRCECCIDDHSAIDLAKIQPVRAARGINFWSRGKRREQKAYSDFLALRETLLNPVPCLVSRPRMTVQTMQVQNHKLCTSCTTLVFRLQYDFEESWFTSWIRSWTSMRNFRLYRHLLNSSELATSANTCHLCAIFWEELSVEQQCQLLQYDAALETTEAADQNLQLQSDRRICIAFDQERGHLIAHFGGLRRPRRWVYPARGHDSELTRKQLRGHEARSPISVYAGDTGNVHMPDILDTGSDLSVEVIERWLKLSKAPINPDWIPSRLVDVSALSTGTVCIKHRRDIPLHDRRYLALSHCWGGPADLRTYNKSTREMFESTIPLDQMAKTFMDLFRLANQLGIRYVWIDALCILQNDSDDWHSEASTMFQVYLWATLTVVAAASWSSNGGLFRAAQSPRKSHCLLYGQSDKGNAGDSCTFAGPKCDLEDAMRPDNNIRWSRWGSRAWTLQEQTLSSRTVYFTETGLAFEKKDVHNGETSGLMMDTTENGVQLDSWMRSREEPEGHDDQSVSSSKLTDTRTDPLRTWWAWVSTYTHRSLTNPNDRAIAILGLAQYLSDPIQHDQKPRYLAGLWEQNLTTSLLWYVRLAADTRPLITRAPTWSWLSVQGGIVNDSVGSTVATTGVEIDRVEEIHPRRPSALENNGVEDISPTLTKGSFIQLRGKVMPLIRFDHAEQPAYYYDSRTDLCVDNYPELLSNAALGALSIASVERVGPRCYPLRLTGLDTEPNVGWYVPDTTDESALPATLHCLSFTVAPVTARSREDFTQPWATRGLALRLTSDQDSLDGSDEAIPTYERVGYFELEWKNTGVYLPFDAHQFKDLKYNPRRVDPEIDPHGVFKDVEPRTLRIY